MARPHAPRGHARARVLDSALELFAEHGVSGTSLQMIADHLGVTKAAVYYQFKAKDDIALALLAPVFERLRATVALVEEATTPDEQRGIALRGLVDLMIEQRRITSAMYRDPELQRIVWSHPELLDVAARLDALLLGPDADARRRVAVSLLGAGLPYPGIDPRLADIAERELRAAMLDVARTLLER